MCYKNIYDFAYKKHIASLSTKSYTKQNMLNILNLLNFKQINKNIIFECNDISHLNWNYTVASRAIIENWKLNKNKYKKFKIKNLKQWEINDFDSMREIAQRRILELKKIWNYPDLIIIDWWKPQLSSVFQIFQKENDKKIKNIQLIWIAKKEEIIYTIQNWNFKEFILEKNSLELKLIQQIRDEAHRFAITFNRSKRIKESKKNILESIPGIWPKTRKKILKEFWSIEKLKNISKKDLEKFLKRNQIEALENHGII
jgi:excinuclease ABC subunit C